MTEALRVGPIHLDHAPGGHRLWAPVHVPGIDGLPEALEMRVVHGSLAPGPAHADAFVVGLLPLAMHLRRPLRVQGAVSARLAYGLRDYQTALHCWWPELFTPVALEVDRTDARRDQAPGEAVACGFSGGVDAFFTVLSHAPARERLDPYRLRHAVMVNGVDKLVDTDGETTVARVYEHYRPVLAEWGVELMLVRSNLQVFRRAVLPKAGLYNSYLSSLASWPLALSGAVGRYLIAGHSTYAYRDLVPQASHLALDHLLCTDQVQIVHFGAHATRAQRVAAIAGEPGVQRTLRVCTGAQWLHPDRGTLHNCGRCEKCVRTQVTLDILGLRERFATFTDPAEPSFLRDPAVLRRSKPVFIDDNLDLAVQLGRDDWVAVLQAARRARATADRRAARRARGPWWRRLGRRASC